MTDHAVLIPTPEGPVGGIVSEPAREHHLRAALLHIPGYGRPARSGINGFWARTARALAERGVVALRIDCSREGETLPIGEGGSGQAWRRELDLRLLDSVVPWFAERAHGLPLLLSGACSGGRLAIEYAGRNPEMVAGTFILVPHLMGVAEPGREGTDLDDVEPVAPAVVECFRSILEHAPSWTLVGDRDTVEMPLLKRLLGPTRHELELEVVPDAEMHFLDRPYVQEQAASWLLTRVGDVLVQHA